MWFVMIPWETFVATVIGGWDVLPYEFRIVKRRQSGTISYCRYFYILRIAFGTANQFLRLWLVEIINLEIRDIETMSKRFRYYLSPVRPYSGRDFRTQDLIVQTLIMRF